MLVFDLCCTIFDDSSNVLAAIVWYESDKENRRHVVASCVEELRDKLIKIYPDQFPSLQDTHQEIITVNNLNVSNKMNSFGMTYPNYVNDFSHWGS